MLSILYLTIEKKGKENTLKAERQKWHIIFRVIIQMTMNFSLETKEVIKKCTTFLKCWKNCQPKIICPAKIAFKNDSEIKIFSTEGIMRESTANRPAKKGWLREVLLLTTSLKYVLWKQKL